MDTTSDPPPDRLPTRRNRRTALQMILEGATDDPNVTADPSILRRTTRSRRSAGECFSHSNPAAPASVTPASVHHQNNGRPLPTSIREAARDSSRSTGRYTGRFYDTDYRHSDIRICYCDQPLAPEDCPLCNVDVIDDDEPCPFHCPVSCAFQVARWLLMPHA
jgi:hypothetical protein